MLFSFFTCFISEGVSGGEAPLSFGTFRHAVFAKGEKGQKVVSAGGSLCRAAGRAALLGFFPVGNKTGQPFCASANRFGSARIKKFRKVKKNI